jgi:L,D-peptidoglycan transpeptidase YkuD (ErfK/YbiS/YcfS/YnhG family)
MFVMHRLIAHTPSGKLFWPGGVTDAAIGKNGVCADADKREGDGKTPLGTYQLRSAFVRQERVPLLMTHLPVQALATDSGWCDAVEDVNYNRFVQHPYAASAEQLWREDGLYDVIVVLGHNDDPVIPGHGSAIFLHCCKYDADGLMKPTLGCVAVAKEALLELLRDATSQTVLHIC